MSVSIKDIYASPSTLYGKQRVVKGWVRFMRTQKRDTMIFIDLFDGSIFKTLSAVVERADGRTPPDVFDKFFTECSYGCSVEMTGTVEDCAGVREQAFEFVVTMPMVVGQMPKTEPGQGLPEYPVQKSVMYRAECLREYPSLRMRAPIMDIYATFRSEFFYQVTDYMRKHKIKKLDPNVITKSDCEGAGETFLVTTMIDPQESVDKNADRMRAQPLPDSVKASDTIDFSHDFFKCPAHLTVSSQLQLEALACALGTVYTDNPSFRAEKSRTFKHVSEFRMIELEVVFCDLPKLMAFTEDFLKSVLLGTLEACRDEFEELGKISLSVMKSKVEQSIHAEFEVMKRERPTDKTFPTHLESIFSKFEELYGAMSTTEKDSLKGVLVDGFEQVKSHAYKKGKWEEMKAKVVQFMYDMYVTMHYVDRVAAIQKYCSKPFYQIKHRDAIDTINTDIDAGLTSVEKLGYSDDLSSDHEKYLVGKFDGFVYVTHWPMSIKSFYMKRTLDDPVTCDNFDLLAPFVGEMFGGSMREDDYDTLLAEMEHRKMTIEPLQWYLDLRKFGSVPHGGWGMGFDRALIFLTGAPSIRDVIPFPVAYQTLYC
jgi:aspartyl/asparaginyl-tRNA synthetase